MITPATELLLTPKTAIIRRSRQVMAFPFKVLLLLFLMFFTQASEADSRLIFVASATTRIDPLTPLELRHIFMKKTRFWKDGKKIRPIDYVVGATARQKFVSEILERTEMQIAEYWIQEKQASGTIQPLQVSNEDMMIYLIENIPGSLGYFLSTPENHELLERKNLKIVSLQGS